MADEKPTLDPFERKYFARCLKSLLEHLEVLRPLLGETHPSDQSINTARQLVQAFVLKETGRSAWDGIFPPDGGRAKRASLQEKTWGEVLPRVFAFRDDRVANSVSLSPPAYAAMTELLKVLFQFSREWLAPTEIRRLAHELRDHAANFIEHKTGKTWAIDDHPKQLVPRVVLKGQAERPEVDGKAVEVLTVARYNTVDALLKAGPDGLTKDRLVKKSGHGSAVNVLKGLAKLSKAWKAVVKLPGSTGKRYALRFQSATPFDT